MCNPTLVDQIRDEFKLINNFKISNISGVVCFQPEFIQITACSPNRSVSVSSLNCYDASTISANGVSVGEPMPQHGQ